MRQKNLGGGTLHSTPAIVAIRVGQLDTLNLMGLSAEWRRVYWKAYPQWDQRFRMEGPVLGWFLGVGQGLAFHRTADVADIIQRRINGGQ